MSVFEPSKTLLVKLGSIAIHADEVITSINATNYLSQGQYFDIATFKELFNDPEVVGWIREMDKLALLPKKR